MKHFFQQIASINSVLQLIVKRLREQENHVNYLCSGSQQRSAPVHPADRQHQHGQAGQVGQAADPAEERPGDKTRLQCDGAG